MQRHVVGDLTFEFPVGWKASSYDNWSFYRNQFSRLRNGIKALDLLAVDPSTKTAWLIEVKDYRNYQRTKPSDLGEEFAHKVFDTLAAIFPAKIHANDDDERRMALEVCTATGLRVVLHLEQPLRKTRLRPQAINPADLRQKIRQLLKPIDPHPLVLAMKSGGCQWKVNKSEG